MLADQYFGPLRPKQQLHKWLARRDCALEKLLPRHRAEKTSCYAASGAL